MSYPKPSDEQHKTEPIGVPPRANRRRGRLRRAVTVTAALAGVALLAAACGGGSAPAAAPSAPAGGGTTVSNTDALPYSQCMRAHGVPNFPDPDPNTPGKPFGALALSQAGVDTSTPQFQAASKACAHLLPASSPAQAQQLLSLMLRYTTCMRAHGVPTFPDPSTTATGGVTLSLTQSAVSSPDFQSAEQACRSIDPALVVPSGSISK
jgi:hypothetical protein